MDKNISHIVVEACKKEGIDYHSINPNYIEFTNATQELVQIDKDLKTIEDKLARIEEKYQVNGLKEIITECIIKLGQVDHEIIKVANKLKNG